MSAAQTPGQTAAFALSIKASTGYRSHIEGSCTPEQFGAAVAALHGNRTPLELELLAGLQALITDIELSPRFGGETWRSMIAGRDLLARAGAAA